MIWVGVMWDFKDLLFILQTSTDWQLRASYWTTTMYNLCVRQPEVPWWLEGTPYIQVTRQDHNLFGVLYHLVHRLFLKKFKSTIFYVNLLIYYTIQNKLLQLAIVTCAQTHILIYILSSFSFLIFKHSNTCFAINFGFQASR